MDRSFPSWKVRTLPIRSEHLWEEKRVRSSWRFAWVMPHPSDTSDTAPSTPLDLVLDISPFVSRSFPGDIDGVRSPGFVRSLPFRNRNRVPFRNRIRPPRRASAYSGVSERTGVGVRLLIRVCLNEPVWGVRLLIRVCLNEPVWGVRLLIRVCLNGGVDGPGGWFTT